jgi:DNA primase
MARYTTDSKERVRDAVDMVDLVGARTELRRSGADAYIGLCPFHDERTPSFSVRPSGKVYYCFGCQAAGDAFNFVMETEGLEFVGAMEYLADRYGVSWSRRRRTRARPTSAGGWRGCSSCSTGPAPTTSGCCGSTRRARAAREYLAGRGLAEAILREFRVGFAPSPWDRVLLGSRRSGFSEAELLAAGVVQRSRERPGSVYDRFRRRITFPLCDQRGHVLGFGARAMSADQQPKYVNSADGVVYHKGRHLFGTHLALACRQGRLDRAVRGLHRRDRRAPVGGAQLRRPDGHRADRGPGVGAGPPGADGRARARRRRRRPGGDDEGARLAAKQRFELRVAALPPGSDPAEVLERDGADAVRAARRSLPFVRFRVERILGGGTARRRRGATGSSTQLRPVFAELGPARCARSCSARWPAA